MKHLSKVVWSEGMYLAPQHFQAQNRYFEDSIQFALATLWRDGYGFTSYELNGEAVRNGTVALVHAGGIFPDGVAFDMPECDALPAPRNIGEAFPPAADSLTVSLAIPHWNAGGPNCDIEQSGKTPARYRGQSEVMADENSGLDEKPVTLGRKNITLQLESERSNSVTLPIARVVRDGKGRFAYDPNFIPPCTKLTASDALTSLAQRLLGILQEKSSMISLGENRSAGQFQTGMSAKQVAQFWFLHTINSHLVPLRHIFSTKHAHPEELYRVLLRLGGALCTFGVDSHPRTLPPYDHRQPEFCFTSVDQHIRQHLEIVLPSQAITIPLVSTERYFYEGEIKDSRCLGRSRWILGVHAAIGEADLISGVPKLMKVCSAKFVPELVKRAVPGMSLTHLSVPPSAMVAKVESQYFVINKGGPCWEHILQSKRIGAYVPGEFPKADLELTVILEN